MQSQHTYQSALGWFDLGNYTEAWNELENLPPKERASIEVMELRCWILRKLEKWWQLEMLSEGCTVSTPNNSRFIADWAWALMKQGKTGRAALILEGRNSPRTQAEPEFCYAYACVLCSLGKPDGAKGWLSRAIELCQDRDAMRLRALDQPELEPLWRNATE